VTGFISKKQTGTFMGMWQKRWFVLQGQEIRYYKHTVGPDVQNVSDKQHIILKVENQSGKYFKLYVTEPNKLGLREFPMYCDTIEHKEMWLAALNSALQGGPVSLFRCTDDSLTRSKRAVAVCGETVDLAKTAALPKHIKDAEAQHFLKVPSRHNTYQRQHYQHPLSPFRRAVRGERRVSAGGAGALPSVQGVAAHTARADRGSDGQGGGRQRPNNRDQGPAEPLILCRPQGSSALSAGHEQECAWGSVALRWCPEPPPRTSWLTRGVA
jgi:hypothetical protein